MHREISAISNRDYPRRPFHLCGCTFDESRLRIRGTCESVPFTDANGVRGEGIDEHRRLLRAGNKLSLPESLGSRSFFTGLSAIVAPPVEINDEETRTNTRRRNEPSLPGAALTKARVNAGNAAASCFYTRPTDYLLYSDRCCSLKLTRVNVFYYWSYKGGWTTVKSPRQFISSHGHTRSVSTIVEWVCRFQTTFFTNRMKGTWLEGGLNAASIRINILLGIFCTLVLICLHVETSHERVTRTFYVKGRRIDPRVKRVDSSTSIAIVV